MPILYFPQYEHELFCRYYDILHGFLAHCSYCLRKWKILNVVHKGMNCETRALFEHWDFVLETLMKLGTCLSGWLGMLMNLRLVVLILTPYPPAPLIMPLLSMKFAIVLAMTVILVFIIFLLIVLLCLSA